MNVLTIILGKIIIAGLRLFKRNGSALPGLFAEKFYPKLLENMLGNLEEGVIVITGTNGKTTTTKATSYLIEQCGRRVLTNQTGSNFTRGIYASIIANSSWTGELQYDVAVLELDEAYSRVFAHRVPPRFVLALNVMRDQLDRYGEISTTASMIGETVSLATEGVVLNYDDPMVAKLAADSKVKVAYFGLHKSLQDQLPSDADLHVAVEERKSRKKHPKKRPPITVELASYKSGSASYRIDSKTYFTRMKAQGIHNAYNFAAALALALKACPDMEPQFLVPAVGSIGSAFGRGEVITLPGGATVTLSLVKNPSGFVQSMKSYANEPYDVTMFAINDDYADGRDISWLWDVSYNSIQSTKIVTTGSRAYDMALRLQYDEKSTDFSSTSISDALAYVSKHTKKSSILYCTYTAMLALRKQLSQQSELEDVWRNK